jgi:peptidoglycan/xylan/chitin deacetylase (PgdA/CDA1 family)
MRAVLMLHGVDDSGSVLSVTADALRSLVHAVRASGHRIVPLGDMLEHRPERAIALTFDDGFVSLATTAAPILAELDAPATLFLTTGYVGRDNRWPTQPADAPHFAMMDWSDVERLKALGWSIEAHCVSHPDLRTLDDAALEFELESPREVIAQRLGHTPRILAYPYGYHDARVVKAAARHYDFALTTVFGTLGTGGAPLRVPRLDAFYFRAPVVHKQFGRKRFDLYLAARGALRRARKHPGEAYR